MAVQIGTAGKSYTLTKAPRPVLRASNGNIYAVLLNTTDNRLEMWKSVDNGVNWTNPGNNQIAIGVGGSCDAHIDGASPQIIHVAWYYSTTAVYYNTFNTSTETWSNAISLATVVATASRGCSIACDSANVPHVVYVDFPSAVVTLKYRNKTGGSWQTAVTVEGSNSRFPNIAIDTTNAAGHRFNLPQIAYCQATSVIIKAALGNANNATSFNLVNPATKASAAYLPSIVIDTNGRTNINYIYTSSGTYQQCVYINGASSWGTAGNWINEANIFSDSDIANSSTLVVNGTNRYIIAEQTTLHDIRKISSINYAAWGMASYLEVGTYQDPRARWQYSNNPSYATYGIDFLFATANPGIVYWDKYQIPATYDAAAGFAAGVGLGQAGGMVLFPGLTLGARGDLSQTPALILNPAMGLQAGAGMAPGSQGDFGREMQFAALAALGLSPANLVSLALTLSGAAAQLQEAGVSLDASLNLPAAGDLTASPGLYLNLALSLPGAAGLDAQAQNDLAATLTLPLSAALALSPANLVTLSLNLAGAAAQLSQAGLELSAFLSFPAAAAAVSLGSLELQLTISWAGAAALIPQVQGDFAATLTLPLGAALQMSPKNFAQASLACAALAVLEAFWTGGFSYDAALPLAAQVAVDWQAAQALAAAMNLSAAALAAYDLRGDWGAELGLRAGVQVDSQAEGDFIAALPLSVLAGAELLAGRTVLATATLEVRAGMAAGAGLAQSADMALAALTAVEISGQQVLVASIGLDAAAAWGLEAAADLLAATVLGGRAEFTLDVPPLRIVCRGNRLLVLLLPQSADVKLS